MKLTLLALLGTALLASDASADFASGVGFERRHHVAAERRAADRRALDVSFAPTLFNGAMLTLQKATSNTWHGKTNMRTSAKPHDGARPASPPHADSPTTGGPGMKRGWKEATRKARAAVAQLSLEERVQLMTGVGWEVGPKPRCVGDIAGIERIGFKGLCLEDSPLGVRFADLVSVFPSGLSTAATFSKALAYARGRAMGEEHRLKGVNVQLGPGMNMHRAPAAGRNWEMNGADPYLSGEAAYYTTKGIQDAGVQACAKHWLGNEQEINRNSYSSNIDDRTSREIYEHPFLRAVQADVASVMSSYNLVNQSWSTQNEDTQNRRLKKEMGFAGWIVSDWGAQHSGVASVLAGLDQTMPGQLQCCSKEFTGSFWGANLTMAVNNGSVPAERVQDAATRILAGWYLLGQDKDYPRPNFDAFDPFYGAHLNAINDARTAVSREVATAGQVLLKNKNGALPFKKLRKLAIVGSDAAPARGGANGFSDRGGVDGVVGIGWGSGTADYASLISPYEALQRRARKEGTGFAWSFLDFDTQRAAKISDERLGVDAAVVFVHSDSGEGYITVDGNAGDRNNLTLWANGDELIQAVAAVNSNTIVVMHSPGQVDMERFADHPNVTAIIQAHMPGSEAGHAIADVLYGDANPSGRLPYTIAKKRSDYSADVIYFGLPDTPESTPQAQIDYTEKLEIDYRHFDAKNIEPRYEFGYGLSYTKWAYSGAKGKWLTNDAWNSREWSWPIPDWLFEPAYEVSFHVKNAGARDGHVVPQVYLGFPAEAGEPPKVLRLFDRVALKAGESKKITWTLSRYDLSFWDTVKQKWVHPESKQYTLYIGDSSRDIRLTLKT